MRFFKRAERPDSGPPSDEKIAAQMRSLAQVFVDGMAAQGETLAWDTASALRLDGLCAEFVTGKPDNETLPYLTAAMGAYLGELVVRNGRGRWSTARRPRRLRSNSPTACSAFRSTRWPSGSKSAVSTTSGSFTTTS